MTSEIFCPKDFKTIFPTALDYYLNNLQNPIDKNLQQIMELIVKQVGDKKIAKNHCKICVDLDSVFGLAGSFYYQQMVEKVRNILELALSGYNIGVGIKHKDGNFLTFSLPK